MYAQPDGQGNMLYTTMGASFANGGQNFLVGPDGNVKQTFKGDSERTSLGNMAKTVAMFGGAAAAGGALAGAGGAGGTAAAGGAAAPTTAAGGSGLTMGSSSLVGAGGAGGTGLTAGSGGVTGLAAGGSTLGSTVAPATTSTGLLGSLGSAVANNPQLAMAGLGAAAGLAGSGDQQSSSQTSMPDWLQPYAQQYAQQAQQVAQTPTTPYGGQMSADLNSQQQQALGGLSNLASNGDPTVNAGAGYTQGVLSGQYLNSNPYFDSMFNNASQRITDAYSRGTAGQTDAMFVKGGAYGGSAHADMTQQNQRALGDSLSAFASNLYGNNYAQERQNQQQAASMAPSYGNQSMQNQQALMSAGTTAQGVQQGGLDRQYNEFLRQQDDPYKRLGAYQGLMQIPGSQTTSTQPGTSAAAGLFGGAMTGAGLWNMYNQQQPRVGVQQPYAPVGGRGFDTY
jgi:hypothetical protein